MSDFVFKFCLPGLRKNFGWWEAGTTTFFVGKITHIFGDTPPVKRGEEFKSERIFRI